MAFTDFAAGAQALSNQLRQLIRCFNGDSGQGQPIQLNATSLPSNYVLAAKNLDDILGQIALFERANGVDILNLTKNGVRFSPDGSTEGLVPASLTGTETLTNKTLDNTSNVGWVKLDSKSGAGASFDFTAIPAGYKHLRVALLGRSDAVALTHAVNVRFNNDSGANYDFALRYANNGAMTAGSGVGQTSANLGLVPCASADAGLFASTMIDLPNYAETTAGNKTAHGRSAVKTSAAANAMYDWDSTAFWRSSAVINQVTLFPNAGSWVAGSIATLYGLVGG